MVRVELLIWSHDSNFYKVQTGSCHNKFHKRINFSVTNYFNHLSLQIIRISNKIHIVDYLKWQSWKLFKSLNLYSFLLPSYSPLSWQQKILKDAVIDGWKNIWQVHLYAMYIYCWIQNSSNVIAFNTEVCTCKYNKGYCDIRHM